MTVIATDEDDNVQGSWTWDNDGEPQWNEDYNSLPHLEYVFD